MIRKIHPVKKNNRPQIDTTKNDLGAKQIVAMFAFELK